jgi:hypothetical protein
VSTTNVIHVSTLGVLYLVLVVTIGIRTHKDGRMALFIVGFLVPPLWVCGAVLPPKRGSKHNHG